MHGIGKQVLDDFAEQDDVERVVLIRKLFRFDIELLEKVFGDFTGRVNRYLLFACALGLVKKIRQLQIRVSELAQTRRGEVWVCSQLENSLARFFRYQPERVNEASEIGFDVRLKFIDRRILDSDGTDHPAQILFGPSGRKRQRRRLGQVFERDFVRQILSVTRSNGGHVRRRHGLEIITRRNNFVRQWARFDGFYQRLADALGNISRYDVVSAALAHTLAQALTRQHFIQPRSEALVVVIDAAAFARRDVVGQYFRFGAGQNRSALGHRFQGHDAETLLGGRHHVNLCAGHQAEFLFRRNKTTKINVLVIGNWNVVFAGQHQLQRRRVLRFESSEIIKELRAAFVGIDPAAVQQIQNVRAGRFARLSVNSHRHDPAWKFSPQIRAQPAL